MQILNGSGETFLSEGAVKEVAVIMCNVAGTTEEKSFDTRCSAQEKVCYRGEDARGSGPGQTRNKWDGFWPVSHCQRRHLDTKTTTD